MMTEVSERNPRLYSGIIKTERTFTITLSAEERFVTLCALGCLWAKIGAKAPGIESAIEKVCTTPANVTSQEREEERNVRDYT